MRQLRKPEVDTTRLNERIRVPQVRLVDENGQMVGVVATEQAIAQAKNAGLDLVEVAPDAKPPVCKILDYGKMRFEERKKKALARKKQKILDTKELQFTLKIEKNDYEVKMRNAQKFLTAGHKVRVVLRFRGRQMAHQELGVKLIERIQGDLAELSKPEQQSKMEGRKMVTILAPLGTAPKTKDSQKKAALEKNVSEKLAYEKTAPANSVAEDASTPASTESTPKDMPAT